MKNQTKTEWTVSDLSNEIRMRSNVFEFQDNKGELQCFTVVATPGRIVFGGVCNVGLIESGYLEREEGESLNEAMAETLADLETYYTDGPQYVSRIVCNNRM